MPRIAVLILVLVLIVGLLFFFSSRVEEVPTSTIETEVSQAPNAR